MRAIQNWATGFEKPQTYPLLTYSLRRPAWVDELARYELYQENKEMEGLNLLSGMSAIEFHILHHIFPLLAKDEAPVERIEVAGGGFLAVRASREQCSFVARGALSQCELISHFFNAVRSAFYVSI